MALHHAGKNDIHFNTYPQSALAPPLKHSHPPVQHHSHHPNRCPVTLIHPSRPLLHKPVSRQELPPPNHHHHQPIPSVTAPRRVSSLRQVHLYRLKTRTSRLIGQR